MKLTHLPFLVLIMLVFCFQSVTISDEEASSDEQIIPDDQLIFEFDSSLADDMKSKYDSRIKFPVPYLLDKHNANVLTDEKFANYAQEIGFKAKGNKVQVIIEFNENADELITPNVVKRYEIENYKSLNKKLKCYMPVNKLERIIDEFPEITQIRPPYSAKPTALTSEGLSLVNAPAWQATANYGSGVTVAIIDMGFQNLSTLINNGDFTNNYVFKDFIGLGINGYGYHGAECAAIVYDFVPNATYYLINVSNDFEYEEAKDYCNGLDIDVISMSLGFDNYWYDDGQSPVCQSAMDMAASGTLLVNSAGNEAQNYYWTGDWKDDDSDGAYNFNAPGALEDESNAVTPTINGTIYLRLTWDTSGTTDQDYNMYLYNSTGGLVAASTNSQTGTQRAYESIAYRVRKYTVYHLVIRRINATGTSSFRLYCSEPGYLQYASSARSIVDPATSPEVFTVGAINHDYWYNSNPIESFSSRGPTAYNDVLHPEKSIKPDICGPDGTISTYYTTGFYGTSASCPHVAGAAALYWASDPLALNASSVRSFLQEKAQPISGYSVPNNTYGYGKLYLPNPDSITVPEKVTLISPPNTVLDQQIPVTLQWQKPLGYPTKYQLMYSNDGFVADSHLVDNITTESYTLSGLSYSTTYSWKVSAYNSAGWGEWSDIWHFTTTLPTAPDKVQLSSPGDTATDQPLTISFQWQEPSGSPDYYRIEVATDISFNNIVKFNYSVSGTSIQFSGFAEETTYYWHVQAYNTVGDGSYSDIWSFKTIPPTTAPGDVVLISPTDGASRQKSTIVFEWDNPLTGGAPTMYWLEIATDSGFNSVIYSNANITGTTIRVSGLPKATTLYWRVRAWNTGGWSSDVTAWVWYFATK